MNKVSVFINSTMTNNKNTIKYKVVNFFYDSIINANDNADLIKNDTKNMNTNICAMLSFFKINGKSKNDILRREIYNNNKNSNWIFFEANPLARYRKHDFNLDNEFSRICLKSQYHNSAIYLDRSKERWNMILNKTGIKVLTWIKNGKHILFVLNSCKHCGYSMKGGDLHAWVNKKIKEIRKSGCKRKIIIRLKCKVEKLKKNKNNICFTHKNEKIIYHDPFGNIDVANTKKQGLPKALGNAWACVLYSTTACVIAVIKGIPVFCSSKDTITYNISNTDFSKIEEPIMPDRTKFFHDFSNQIWSLEEIKKGIVWNKIKNIYK